MTQPQYGSGYYNQLLQRIATRDAKTIQNAEEQAVRPYVSDELAQVRKLTEGLFDVVKAELGALTQIKTEIDALKAQIAVMKSGMEQANNGMSATTAEMPTVHLSDY